MSRRKNAAKNGGAPQAPAPQPLIYIGPNQPRGFLRRHMVFTGGFPLPVRETLKAFPKLARLLVPTADFARASRDVARAGSLLNTTFIQARDFFVKEANNG